MSLEVVRQLLVVSTIDDKRVKLSLLGNDDRLLNSNISVGIVFPNTLLIDVTSINILIIDKATSYEFLDQSNGQRLASSIVVVGLRRSSSHNIPINISLTFQVLDEYRYSLIRGSQSCSYYDPNSLRWNTTGCTLPIYNNVLQSL